MTSTARARARHTISSSAVRGAAGRALEQALELAESDGWLLPFLLHPAKGLLEFHARHRTAHVALIAEIQSLLAGSRPAPPPAGPQPVNEPLSDAELRVLRYLPASLPAAESRTPRATLSGPTCATCSPSSERASGPAPSRAPVPSACWHPPRPGVRPRLLADGRSGQGLAGGFPWPHAGSGEVVLPAGSGAGSAPDRSWRVTRITASAMISASTRTPAETR